MHTHSPTKQRREAQLETSLLAHSCRPHEIAAGSCNQSLVMKGEENASVIVTMIAHTRMQARMRASIHMPAHAYMYDKRTQ